MFYRVDALPDVQRTMSEQSTEGIIWTLLLIRYIYMVQHSKIIIYIYTVHKVHTENYTYSTS